MKKLLFFFTFLALYGCSHGVNDYLKFPSYRKVVNTFFEKYSATDVPDTVLMKFEKRPDGWHVTEHYFTKENDYKTLSDQLFWSLNSGDFKEILFGRKGLKALNRYGELSTQNQITDFLGGYHITEEYNFNISPYYNYTGYAKDVIDDYGDAGGLPDSVMYAVAEAYFNYADDMLNDNSGLSDKKSRFILKDGKNSLSADQLEAYRKYYYKGYEKMNELKKFHPNYEGIVGNVNIKLSNMYVNAYLEMLMYQNEQEAVKELPDGLYDEFMVTYAKNYLASCEKDAILFTNGDNDTYPLIYVQARLGFRTDIMIVNLSLLNTNRYLDCLHDGIMKSQPLPASINANDYKEKGDAVFYVLKYDTYQDISRHTEPKDLKILVEKVKMERPKDKVSEGLSSTYYEWPSKNVFLKHGQDSIIWKIDKRYLYQSDLSVLDIIATNNWQRPIYFGATTSTDSYIGLKEYLQQEGYVLKLVPYMVESSEYEATEASAAYNNLMKNYSWNGNDKMVSTEKLLAADYRIFFWELSENYFRRDKKDSAMQVLNKCMELFPDKYCYYDRITINLMEGYYKLGEVEKANAIANTLLHNFKNGLDNEKGLWRYTKANVRDYAPYLKNIFETYKQADLLSQVDLLQ